MDLLINPIKQSFEVIKRRAVEGKQIIKSHCLIYLPSNKLFWNVYLVGH